MPCWEDLRDGVGGDCGGGGAVGGRGCGGGRGRHVGGRAGSGVCRVTVAGVAQKRVPWAVFLIPARGRRRPELELAIVDGRHEGVAGGLCFYQGQMDGREMRGGQTFFVDLTSSDDKDIFHRGLNIRR